MKKVLLLIAICATTAVFSTSAQDVKKEKKTEVKKDEVVKKTEEVKESLKEETKTDAVTQATIPE